MISFKSQNKCLLCILSGLSFATNCCSVMRVGFKRNATEEQCHKESLGTMVTFVEALFPTRREFCALEMMFKIDLHVKENYLTASSSNETKRIFLPHCLAWCCSYHYTLLLAIFLILPKGFLIHNQLIAWPRSAEKKLKHHHLSQKGWRFYFQMLIYTAPTIDWKIFMGIAMTVKSLEPYKGMQLLHY